MATLAVNEIMFDIIEAFKLELFPLSSISLDLKPTAAVLNSTVIAHIDGLPSASTYDATTGFANGAVEAETLLTDVSVVLDQMPTVPVKIDYLTQLASQVPLYQRAVRNVGHRLAKTVLDDMLAEITAANFTHAIAVGAAENTTLDTLEQARSQLNSQNAASMGRFAILNTAAAGSLGTDARVASGDFYGQTSAGAGGYRRWQNMAGFSNVWEYPDLPTTGSLYGFAGDPRAIVFASRPVQLPQMTASLGITQVNSWSQLTDPETGLTFTGVGWEVAGVADVFFVVSVLYGVKAGAQGGAANAITDRAGVRMASA